ncbi:hypothetical protein BH20ACI1_BH20ACI1_32690 [soil metagenome]
MEVVLNLPKKLVIDLSESAAESKKSVDEVVSERLQNFSISESKNTFSNSSDEEVLRAAKLWMPEKQSNRHSELLYKNQAGTLTANEKTELDFFQQVYRLALVRKSEGIAEALRRGLIETVDQLQ